MSRFRSDRVRELMHVRGFSQDDLARRVGIKQPSINRLLQGAVQKPRHLHQIAAALHTTTAYLMDETDSPSIKYGSSSQAVRETATDDLGYEQQLLFEHFERLSAHDKDAVLALVTALAQKSSQSGLNTRPVVHDKSDEYKSQDGQ